MTAARFIIFTLAVTAVGCGGNTPAAPTASASAPVPTTETYTGPIGVGGSLAFGPFTVSATGTAAVNLASVTLTPTGPATSIALGVGIGPTALDDAGNTICAAPTESATVAPALTAQFSPSVTVASCLTVFDPGTLKAPVTFLVRVVHP